MKQESLPPLEDRIAEALRLSGEMPHPMYGLSKLLRDIQSELARLSTAEHERNQWRDAHDAAAADAKKWRRDAQEAVGKLCRAREVVNTWVPGWGTEDLKMAVEAALSGSASCRHEAEVKRLREAVEWALHQADGDMNYDYVMTELRRRAGEVGDGKRKLPVV